MAAHSQVKKKKKDFARTLHLDVKQKIKNNQVLDVEPIFNHS